MKTSATRSRIPIQTRKVSRARNGNGHIARKSETKVSSRAAAWLKKPKQNLIGGKWTPAASGKFSTSSTPPTRR